MAADQPLINRVYYACVLWSVCGPVSSDRVVKKDRSGFIERSGGEPILATQKDIRELLELPESSKGNISRTIRLLNQQGFLTFDGEAYYLEADPMAYDDRTEGEDGCNTATWNIAGVVVSTDNLPADPDARIAAENALQELNTGYNKWLKQGRTDYRQMLVQVCKDHGIIIGFKKTEKREETATAGVAVNGSEPQPAAAAVLSLPDPTPEPPALAPPVEPTTDEVAAVRTALAPFGPADFETAERLIVRCRQKCPDATAPEVAQMISEKSPSITRNTQNPVALLMKIVPPAFEGYRETMDWEQAAKRKVADLEKRLLDPDCLTVVEAEAEYGIPETVLFELIESAALPFIDVGPRPGGKYRIMRRDLEAFKKPRG